MRSRILKGILAVVIAFVGLSFILPECHKAIFVGPSVHGARAMLDPDAPDDSLPAQVTLTLDDATATFHRGDAGYSTLLSVLRAVRFPDAVQATGTFPSISDGRMRCGDLAITSRGATSHFLLARSASNPRYFWLRLPHLNRGGFGFPMFIDDGRLTPLVQTGANQKQ